MGASKQKRGRGALSAPADPYQRYHYEDAELDGVDPEVREEESDPGTTRIRVYPKKAVHRVESPDIGLCYSMNPYQGCEHGCVYCYARNSHPYWGYSAGLDFEQKVLVKANLLPLLEKELRDPNWELLPMMLSGNTDCYQPIERQERLTRGTLELFLRFGQPVGIVTKNRLITRDIDLLEEMASKGLVHVNISLTTLDEDLRQMLEPRTAAGKLRLKLIRELTERSIPVRALIAPVIPSLNGNELPSLVQGAAEAGARDISMAMVRLNGQLPAIFEEWLEHHYPERKEKVLHQIADLHGGQVNDSRFGKRLKGEGALASSLHSLFQIAVRKHFKEREMPPLNLERFDNGLGTQLGLFGSSS
ncbi:MAG: PA0069 family radical SAM protein [Flavobacteriales bacterium]